MHLRKEHTDFFPPFTALESIDEDYSMSWKLTTEKWEILKEQLERQKLKPRQV